MNKSPFSHEAYADAEMTYTKNPISILSSNPFLIFNELSHKQKAFYMTNLSILNGVSEKSENPYLKRTGGFYESNTDKFFMRITPFTPFENFLMFIDSLKKNLSGALASY